MSRRRIASGIREIESSGAGGVRATGRERAPGGGRKRLAERDPGLASDLERLVDPATRGDPEGPLLWTSLSAEKLADALRGRGHEVSGRTVSVCHFPPGTSKWNKIEHRLFSRIAQNWRARPLVSREAVVELIANTTTGNGLTVRAELDENEYPKGVKVTDERMAALSLARDKFHGDWNYTISPTRKPND